MTKAGRYIVIEGVDGSGKSTILEHLTTQLIATNLSPVLIHEPGGTAIGEQIRTALKDRHLPRHTLTELLLFTAARYQSWQQVIAPALEQGNLVLSSRNYLSSLVYQGHARGLGIKRVQQITEQFLPKRYLQPDLTVILTINSQVAKMRRSQRNHQASTQDTFESQGQTFQDKLTEGYELIIKQHPDYHQIDADQPVELIVDQIRQLIAPLLRK